MSRSASQHVEKVTRRPMAGEWLHQCIGPSMTRSRIATLPACRLRPDPNRARPSCRARHAPAQRQVLVRRMLRAAGIGVRHPDRRQAEHLGEDIVRQRAARIGQHGDGCWLVLGFSEAAAQCAHGMIGIGRVAARSRRGPCAISRSESRDGRGGGAEPAGSRPGRCRPRSAIARAPRRAAARR